MKRIIIVVLCLSIVFGVIVYINYNSSEEKTIYLVQVGAYKDYNNLAYATKEYNNYIVNKEDNLYKIYVGVSTNLDNYKKISDLYNANSYKKELVITDKELYEELEKYDYIINKMNSNSDINMVVKEELKLVSKLFSVD